MHFLFVGRLEPYKNVDKILKLIKYYDDYNAVIIGSGSIKDNLIKYSLKNEIYNKVRFLEGISYRELIKYYKSAKVFISLSKFESYGITVAEALSCKTPCIVNNNTALTDFVNGVDCVEDFRKY
ncbi:MAG: glycosyltransferase [Candidatus Marinimicrobia bacterium]|nr:glycosyltransferase [Candidatus Neomarinimicrobiota bacterium]